MPGTTAWQLTSPAAAREIEGYASLTSVNVGSTINLFVSTADPTYTINVYRVGWYGGTGGRLVFGPVTRTGGLQATPVADGYGMYECRWTNAYVLPIPPDWVSGVYVAKLTGSSGHQSYILFVVREDARGSDFLFQSSVTTFQAYNNWPGSAASGRSLYDFNSVGGAAVKVSFNRPYAVDPNPIYATQVGSSFFLRWEINMLRWLEMSGYDVAYCTNVDVHENPALLPTHKAFLIVGHDEYWSWQMRANIEAGRDSGVGIGVFASNVAYWQIRFESSPATGAADRTVVGYKANIAKDPTPDPCLLTTFWRNNVCQPSEQSLLGVEYVEDNVGCPSQASCVDMVIADPTSWALAGTGLTAGARIPSILGYEVDGVLQSNSPWGTAVIARSPIPINYSYVQAHPYSDMTSYTAGSGATVFATGTMQWSWALDDWGAPGQHISMLNAAAQQITRNVLARLVVTAPPAPIGPVSDDFAGTNLNSSVWTFVNPKSDATLSVAGSRAIINVPGGVEHDLWATGENSPRIVQKIPNADFEISAKFDSVPTLDTQTQGIVIEQDSANFIRFDIHYIAGNLRLFAAVLKAGSPTIVLNSVAAVAFPLILKVNRTQDTWTFGWSSNGTSYTTAVSFSQPITVNRAGVFAGNCCAASAPPFTSQIDYFVNTADPFVAGPLTVGGVSVTPNSAMITWSTLYPMTSQVTYGPTSAYGYQTAADPSLVTAHSQALVGLSCATVYHYQIVSTAIGSDENPGAISRTADATFATGPCANAPPGPPVSDDFNAASINSALWTPVNPLNDAVFAANGSELTIAVPGGASHDPWSTSTDVSPRLMQSIAAGDFEVTVKIDSPLTADSQNEGLIVEQDSSNFLRFEVYRWAGVARLFSGSSIGGVNTVRVNSVLSASWPLWLKVNRTGNVWTFSWSADGAAYTTATTFTQAITASRIGPFAANCCAPSSPAFIARFDYFRTNQSASQSPGAPVSDNFDAASLSSMWTFVNPRADASASTNGSQALINLPAGSTHDPWDASGNTSPRIMQPIGNGDFEVVAKFDSPAAINNQNQGLMVEQDATTFLRFEVYYASGAGRLFGGTTVAGVSTVKLNTAVAASSPVWLKLNRTGSVWTLSWSSNGATYSVAASFTQALTANRIGLFAANCCGATAPAFTSKIDYFFNTLSPLSP